MAEIVGVAITATQLALSCISAIDLLKRIKGGSSALERYQQQLQELRWLSDSIAQNPLLQTAPIGDSTQSLLCLIESTDLDSLLQKGRLQRTLSLLQKQRNLSDIFTSIEHQKSFLCLLIEELQARALHQIQEGVKRMTTQRASGTASPLPDISCSCGLAETCCECQALVPLRSRSSCRSTRSSSSDSLTSHLSASRFEAKIKMAEERTNTSANKATATYNNMVAGHGIDQINGDDYEMSSEDIKKIAMSDSGMQSTYEYIVSKGSGSQCNGDRICFVGDIKDVMLPSMAYVYKNISIERSDSAAPGTFGKQVNGRTFRRKSIKKAEEK